MFRAFGRQRDAIGHMGMAVIIIAAHAAAPIQHPAGDIGCIKCPSLFVFQLVNAAFAAPIAERFPLSTIKRVQWQGFPESVADYFTH
jgi:hypothetical protein